MKKTLAVLSTVLFLLVLSMAAMMIQVTWSIVTPSHEQGTKLSSGGSFGSTITLSSEAPISATSMSEDGASWLVDQTGKKVLETTELMPGKFMTKGTIPPGTYMIDGVPASFLFTSDSNISLTFNTAPRIKTLMLVMCGLIVFACLWLVVTFIKMWKDAKK